MIEKNIYLENVKALGCSEIDFNNAVHELLLMPTAEMTLFASQLISGTKNILLVKNAFEYVINEKPNIYKAAHDTYYQNKLL